MGRGIKIGICTGVVNAKALEGSGVDFIEEHVQGFLKPEAGEDESAPNLEAARTSPQY